MNNILGIATKLGQRYFGRGILIVRKYSPEILTAVGIAGGVGAAVMGARATLKLEPIVSVAEASITTIKDVKSHTTDAEYPRYNYMRDLAEVYATASIKVVRLYAPAVGVGFAAAGCVLGAHGIMRRRNAALVVAYQALERGYAAYRQRVIEEFGEEKDRDYRYGIREGKTHVHTLEDGTKRRVTDATVDPTSFSPYARFFDESNVNWTKTPEYNHFFLSAQQNWANELLHSRGHIFLNEVYDALGLPRSQAGQFVGWFDNGEGDNYVDFGIYSLENAEHRAFVNGYERSILLDFNVDGIIYDKIGGTR